MTTLEQAARQALEALDGLIPYLFLTDETRWGQYYKALSALRQALENHESAYQRGYLDGMAKPCIDCADRKLQAMKHPQQDSVEWEQELLNLLCRIHRDGRHYIAEHGIRKAIDDADLRVAKLNAINDTATPPKREWVGLTDEEIAQGLKESWVTEQAFKSAVWWAEERLKELNT